MDVFLKTLQNDFFLKAISNLAQRNSIKIYLVGGALRDSILKRDKENLDFDFAVDKNALKLAKDFSKKIKGAFVILDKTRGYARVVKNTGSKTVTYDFAKFRGKNIKEDLRLRDFTINTLALNLKSPVLINQFRGIEDLKKTSVRMVSVKSFLDDPLRLLRAFSLAAQLNFKIEPKTLKAIRKLSKNITESAYERIRDEFFKILETERSVDFIRQMDRVKILDKIIPQIRAMYRVSQGPYHHLDVWKHSLETLNQLENLFKELADNKKIQDYLKEKIAAERSRASLIKLGALLHDIGKPSAKKQKEGKTIFYGHERLGREITKGISELLKLSSKEKFSLEKLIFRHLWPGYLTDEKAPSARAVFRFFRDTADDAVAVLLIGIADQRATRGPLTKGIDRGRQEKIIMDLIERYFKKQEEKPFVRLINGNDLIKKLKLTPSPLFAKILQEVEEAQAEGTIKTKKAALELAKKVAKDDR